MDVFFISIFTNCTPLLADLFLYYSYEEYFIRELLKKNEKKLSWSFNFIFCYKDDVLLLYNSKLDDFVDRTFHIEFEIKNTIHIDKPASYLDIDSENR